MAVTVDYLTSIISVPQADLTFVSGTLYELDTDWLRLQLHALQDDEEGMPFDDMIDRNEPYTVVGVSYAQKLEIINGYSLQFTPDSQWSVRLTGSNNNFFDVENGILVQNQVQVIPNNSAGLIKAEILAPGVAADVATIQTDIGTIQVDLDLVEAILRNRREISSTTGVETVYEDDSATPKVTRQVYEDEAGAQTYRGQGVERADRFS